MRRAGGSGADAPGVANLLDNALKYTSEGGTVRVSCRTAAERVIVIFDDTGMGISSEEQGRIWGRLYRGDKSAPNAGSAWV